MISSPETHHIKKLLIVNFFREFANGWSLENLSFELTSCEVVSYNV
jgi:hypothetical protein